MWPKGKNCMKQPRGLYIYRMKTYKVNNHLVRFHAKSIAAWSKNAIYIYIYIYIDIDIYIYTPIICEHTIQELFMDNGVSIFEILHMTQNPDLHVGPPHLTIKCLLVIKRVAYFTSCGKLVQILESWKANQFISKLMVFTLFGLI